MRRLIAVLPLCLLLTGCEERVAEFAKKADDLLNEYQKRIDSQIADATDYYHSTATLSAAQNQRVQIATLQAEREERSTQLEADYRERRKPVSLYRDNLRAYAEVDFAQLKARLTAEMDASAPYFAQVVALEADKATIDAYDKILKNLAQPRSILAEIADMQQFVADSKTEFSKLVCADIAKQLAAKPNDPTLTALQKSQKCPTK